MTARKEPPLPDKVKVGPLTYDVSDDSLNHVLAEHDSQSRLDGRCHHAKQQIVLDPSLAAGQRRATLLHEVTHAALSVSGIRLEDDEEERIVRALEMPLLGVLRDNPVLVAYLVGGTA